MKKPFIITSVIILALAAAAAVTFALTYTHGVFVSPQTKRCIECHEAKNIQHAQIQEWKKSTHAKSGVGCWECHQAQKGDADAWDDNGYLISTIVSPKDCARCHKREEAEFSASHHAKAGEILGSADNYLGEAVEGAGASMQGCQSCHGGVIKVGEKGKLDYTTWPNMGIGRLNPDGTKGSCAACHSRHRFSVAVARSPEACGKCHLGPDHPQKEIYDESKHGINYQAHKAEMKLGEKDWILGKQYTQSANCVTCHMGGNKYLARTHEVGGRISWTLRPAVSVKQENWEKKRVDMQKVCLNCHAPEWVNNHYAQFDSTVGMYNEHYAKPATEIMDRLRKKGALTATPFDEEIEWAYYELWHHEGRRARHGAAMMGPDYVQWHGFYEVAQQFYNRFLPLARKKGEGAFIDSLLAKPEHSWAKGIKPENLKFQEEAYKKWSATRDALNAEKKP